MNVPHGLYKTAEGDWWAVPMSNFKFDKLVYEAAIAVKDTATIEKFESGETGWRTVKLLRNC